VLGASSSFWTNTTDLANDAFPCTPTAALPGIDGTIATAIG
jgi:hypothetical protein